MRWSSGSIRSRRAWKRARAARSRRRSIPGASSVPFRARLKEWRSALQIEPLKRFGASPLSMPFGEVLPALQNRTIDGVWAGTTLFTALKFYDIAKTMTYLPSHWAATVPLVNRNFIKSLGPDLEKVVRGEARKADEHTLTWAAEDIKRSEKIWAQNGGKEIHLSPAEQKRFLDESIAAATPILTATPQGKEDYEAFAAAAKKYRK